MPMRSYFDLASCLSTGTSNMIASFSEYIGRSRDLYKH
jgi:hypothetical protein